MRYALIDNSTLTAVQRVLGGIPIKNKHLIDADILALESFIQAILFYDKIVSLDDYKEEYRSSRQDYFGNLLLYKPSETGYNSLLLKAKELTESIVPCVEAGTFTDGDFKPFFDQLRMNTTFTWNLQSSVYYLNMKMLESVGGLDLPKYNTLSSMIFAELIDNQRVTNNNNTSKAFLYDASGTRINSTYVLTNKKGEQVELGGLSNQVKAFFAGLNWLSLRTVLYSIAAKELGADLILHPIRNAFQVNLLSKLHSQDPSVFRPILNAMNGVAHSTVNKVFATTQPVVLSQPLPMFTAWLAGKTRDPHKFIETAYEIRMDKSFLQARQQLIELEQMVLIEDRRGFLSNANKLIGEVSRQMERICEKFGVHTPKGVALSAPIFAWNVSVLATGLSPVPNFSGEIRQLDFLKDIIPAKGFKAVYRNMLHDLNEISSLSEYHDIISSKVVLDKESGYFGVKQEERRFSGRESYFKIPM